MTGEPTPLPPLRTGEEILKAFADCGVPITVWARANGFSDQTVRRVLHGKSRSLRGESHRIAVLLGMKRGTIGTLADVDKALEEFRAQRFGLPTDP